LLVLKEKMQHVKQTWGYIIDPIHFTFFNCPCEIGVIALTTNKYWKELEYQNDTPKKSISNQDKYNKYSNKLLSNLIRFIIHWILNYDIYFHIWQSTFLWWICSSFVEYFNFMYLIPNLWTNTTPKGAIYDSIHN